MLRLQHDKFLKAGRLPNMVAFLFSKLGLTNNGLLAYSGLADGALQLNSQEELRTFEIK